MVSLYFAFNSSEESEFFKLGKQKDKYLEKVRLYIHSLYSTDKKGAHQFTQTTVTMLASAAHTPN